MANTATAQYSAAGQPINLPFIIGASSVGTLIEWYDFYLYGVLALFFSKHFFAPSLDPNVAFILSLFVFWTGFLVRPFGAIVFGHLGDLIGRKFTFMLTLLLMGAAFSLALVGQVWHNAHYAAPATGLVILLVIAGMRRLQLWRRPGGRSLVRCLPMACAAMTPTASPKLTSLPRDRSRP